MSIEDNIKKYGWQYQFVFDEAGENADFSYTIGLEESFSHPEIMIFGLKKDQMHSILSDLVDDIKRGRVFNPNKKTGDVVAGDYEVIFKPLKEEYIPEYAGVAERYYKKTFRVYIMLWPDKNNLLPTEPNCELTVQNEALQII
ncbi:MAG: DUF4262 domain-containing protein [Candidatus Sedimenticola sp. (ex Thyasira tokunagai)]